MASAYTKILVPVDGSENSFKALSHAITLARKLDAKIGILYVTVLMQQMPIAAQLNGVYVPEVVYAHLDEFGRNVVEKAQAQVPTDIKVETFCEIGSPATVIPEFAEENGYDMIVIGSRGLGVIKGLVMGSVSTYVIHHAHCPVLVVR